MKATESGSAVSAPGRWTKIVSYYLGHFLIYLGCVIIALVIVWLIFTGNRIYAAYRAASQHLDSLETALQTCPAECDWAQVEASLNGMVANLEIIQEGSRPFLALTPYAGWIPVYGGDLRVLPHLVAAGQDLSQTALTLVKIVSPALGPEAEVSGVGILPYLADNLPQERTNLEQAELLLRAHQAVVGDIDVEDLSPALAGWVPQLNRYLAQMISGLQLARAMPVLLGADGARTYLLLMQNSDELRPSGGYINAAGHIVFDRGQIVEFEMQDSYAIDRLSEDYPYPPDPLYQYMAAEYWVLRDAGWSPDFPTTARTAIELYERGQDISADGVIAIDQQALPYLLRAFESIRVEGELVTSDNVIDLMRQHWAPETGQGLDSAWWSQRKSFMVALAETVRQELDQGLNAGRLPVLVRGVQQGLAEKHVLVYLKDPAVAELLANKHWNGALQPVQGDYLMVVDANVGFNKASALVDQRITYQVALARDGSAQAHATLVYQHQAQKRFTTCSNKLRYDPVYTKNMERCYWDYVRFIAPAAAQLANGPRMIVDGEYLPRGRSTTGEIDVEALVADKVSWGQLFLLAPEESLALDYTYSLPPGTARGVGNQWVYSLYLQKQPGTLAPAAEVFITLPEAAQLLKSEPLPTSQQGGVNSYVLHLDTDQQIEILYRLP